MWATAAEAKLEKILQKSVHDSSMVLLEDGHVMAITICH